MTTQWTPTGDKRPQMAMVMVDPSISAEPDNEGRPCVYVKTDQSWWWHRMPICCLRPTPSAITPEQQAVLDKAVTQEAWSQRSSGKWESYQDTNEAVRAMLAAQQPPNPVARVKTAFALLEQAEARGTGTDVDRARCSLRAAIAALEAKS